MQKWCALVFATSLIGAQPFGFLQSSVAEETPFASMEADLEALLEARPDLILRALTKNSEQFVDAVNHAIEEAAAIREKRAAAELDEIFSSRIAPTVEFDVSSRGSENATITIVEYTDFQCPYCSKVHITLNELFATYPTQLQLYLKHLPLSFHPMALPAATYFEAIALQDRELAWRFHDLVLENQTLLNKSGDDVLRGFSIAIGVDMTRLDRDRSSQTVVDRIEKDMAEAAGFGLTGTPAFVLNGVIVSGAQSTEYFTKIIDRLLAEQASAVSKNP